MYKWSDFLYAWYKLNSILKEIDSKKGEYYTIYTSFFTTHT